MVPPSRIKALAFVASLQASSKRS